MAIERMMNEGRSIGLLSRSNHDDRIVQIRPIRRQLQFFADAASVPILCPRARHRFRLAIQTVRLRAHLSGRPARSSHVNVFSPITDDDVSTISACCLEGDQDEEIRRELAARNKADHCARLISEAVQSQPHSRQAAVMLEVLQAVAESLNKRRKG